MALFYGREVRDRLDELGITDDVCTIAHAIYEELRVLWQEVAQRIGMSAGYLKSVVDDPEFKNYPQEVRDIATMIADDEIRREVYTGPIREYMEAIYSGGSGSAGGLGLVSYVCGFQSDARYLWTRRSIEDELDRVISLLIDAQGFAERYGVSSIKSTYALVEDMNSVLMEAVGDIVDKPVFNMDEIRDKANEAIKAIKNFVVDVDTFIGAMP